MKLFPSERAVCKRVSRRLRATTILRGNRRARGAYGGNHFEALPDADLIAHCDDPDLPCLCAHECHFFMNNASSTG